MMRSFATLLVVCGCALAGCSGGTDTSNSQTAQANRYFDLLRSSRSEPDALPTLTPDLVAGLTVPTLEVQVEDTDQTAYLISFSDRTDASPGDIRVWRTADNVQIILRAGVLIATRGLGNDLGSSDTRFAVASVQKRAPVSGAHVMYFKTGENGISKVDLVCEMRAEDVQNIEIVKRAFRVVHLQETCTGSYGRIVNDYWVDHRDSTIWQSRQWAGPETGYIKTRLLKK